MVKNIRIEDYSYTLPEDRIARYPLPERDDSKLLVYADSNCRVPETFKFRDIAELLPEKSIVVFNETKVVPARLLFSKDTGATIEIFCLEPADPADYQQCFASVSSCCWKAIVGNSKRWKEGRIKLLVTGDDKDLHFLSSINLEAERIGMSDDASIIRFIWDGGWSFSQVLEQCGHIPIPPYLKRESEAVDLERYQTCYALREGSVAAPTAGLHFTRREMDALESRDMELHKLCLHVGAGTFLPVKSESIGDHLMHSEPFTVSKSLLEMLRDKADRPLIAVGTTSTRCLESLYYIGVHCIEQGKPSYVEQWEPYREYPYKYSLSESVDAILEYMDRHGLDSLTSQTRIIIVPGFRFRATDYLVTNFHQPKSTLLLLIAAFIGEKWRDIYEYALGNSFRFLSYGDSSLLQKDKI